MVTEGQALLREFVEVALSVLAVVVEVAESSALLGYALLERLFRSQTVLQRAVSVEGKAPIYSTTPRYCSISQNSDQSSPR